MVFLGRDPGILRIRLEDRTDFFAAEPQLISNWAASSPIYLKIPNWLVAEPPTPLKNDGLRQLG